LQDDLFTELTAAGIAAGVLPEDLEVKDIMDTWTTQKGFPLITVDTTNGLDNAVVSQRRFVLGPSEGGSYSWQEPLLDQ